MNHVEVHARFESAGMLNQTFQPRDLVIVGVLAGLECLLSIDNALVLGMLARKVPHGFRKKALTYGMIGAVVLRLIAVLLASRLLQWRIVKLLGGGYLLYVAVKHLWTTSHRHSKRARGSDEEIVPGATPAGEHAASFWRIVVSIELTDMAFAVDSVLAAIALVGEAPPGTPVTQLHPKLWVVMVGGLIGVVAMRFAAVMFIKLLERFPRFELSAYLMVLVIGLKLILEWAFNGGHEVLNFQSPHHAPFWAFWLTVMVLFGLGFVPRRKQPRNAGPGIQNEVAGAPQS